MSTQPPLSRRRDQSYFVNGTLVFITIIAALGWIFSKESLNGMPPLFFIGLRFFLAALIMLAFGWQKILTLSRIQWLYALSIGAAQAVALVLWILAVNSSNRLGEGAFIMSISMIIVPLLARLFYKEPLARQTLHALPVTITGLALLALSAGWHFELSQALYLVASTAIATQFLLTSHHGRQLPTEALTCIQLAIVSVVSTVLSLLFEQWPTSLSNESLMWLTASVTIATSLRYFLTAWCQKRMSTGNAAALMTLEPVWTALFSALWLGDIMTLPQITGCALVLAALFIARRK